MNVDTLMAAMPGLPRAKAQAYLPHNDKAMVEFGITNTRRAWMWLAQVGHESLSLRYLEEIHDGSNYEGRKDLGNTHPGDGKKYKGRGPIQITGRYNYTEAGKALKLDLVNKPQLAAEPQYAFRVSAWWWQTHGLNPISDTGDVKAATRRINGGYNGLADRESRYRKCQTLGPTAVLPGSIPPPPQGVIPVAIATALMKDGRMEVFVEAQPAKAGECGQVFHTWQAKDGGWVGQKPGNPRPKWESMGTPGK